MNRMFWRGAGRYLWGSGETRARLESELCLGSVYSRTQESSTLASGSAHAIRGSHHLLWRTCAAQRALGRRVSIVAGGCRDWKLLVFIRHGRDIYTHFRWRAGHAGLYAGAGVRLWRSGAERFDAVCSHNGRRWRLCCGWAMHHHANHAAALSREPS